MHPVMHAIMVVSPSKAGDSDMSTVRELMSAIEQLPREENGVLAGT